MNNLLIIKDTLIMVLMFCGFAIVMYLYEYNKYKNLLLIINILMISFSIEAWVTYYETFPKTENDIGRYRFFKFWCYSCFYIFYIYSNRIKLI